MKSRFFPLEITLLILLAYLVNGIDARAQEMDVIKFVHQTFIHGVPYEQAIKFDSTNVPILLEMLENPKEEPQWPNIVVTLCIIGHERTVDTLISFFAKGDTTTLSYSHYAAKTSMLMGFGYLINKSGNQKALTYLIDSLNPEVWTERRLNWRSPYQPDQAERNRQLMSLAIMGLALSGHPAAKEALLSVQQRTGAGAPDKELIAEALRIHEIITREGLVAYYQKNMLN